MTKTKWLTLPDAPTLNVRTGEVRWRGWIIGSVEKHPAGFWRVWTSVSGGISRLEPRFHDEQSAVDTLVSKWRQHVTIQAERNVQWALEWLADPTKDIVP